MVTTTKTSGMFISLRIKLVFAIVTVLFASVCLNSTLNYLNFEKRLVATSDSTYQVVVDETYADIQQAMNLGLPLASIANIQSLLERRALLVEGISEFSVTDTTGKKLFTTGQNPEQNDRLISLPIYNAFDVVQGELKLFYSPQHLEAIKSQLKLTLLINGLLWLVACSALGYLLLTRITGFIIRRVKRATGVLEAPGYSAEARLGNIREEIQGHSNQSPWSKAQSKYFPLMIIGLAIMLTLIANIGSSYQGLSQFSELYQQQLEQKTVLIGDTLSQMIARLLESGIPLNRLSGLEQEFAHYISHHPELLSVSLESGNTSLYQYPAQQTFSDAASSSLPVGSAEGVTLGLTTDTNIIPKLVEESAMDMLTVLIASCLVVAEIILFVCNFMITQPWRQVKRLLKKQAQHKEMAAVGVQSHDELGRLIARFNQVFRLKAGRATAASLKDYRFIRLPLFILVFAEAASLAFFPTYVSGLSNSQGWLPPELVASLPISLFMLCWAVSLPFAGHWSDKVGRRKSLMTGGLITSAGLMATAFCTSLELLLLIRAFTAVGYGIVFISAQGYVTDTTSAENRTKGMSTFISAFFSGSLCGAAIGGIIADKLGYPVTFALASCLAFTGVILVVHFFSRESGNSQTKPLCWSDFRGLLSNKYFALISLLSAIPAKLILTGFLYYLCPVYLQYLGESSAVSGRVIMTYGLAIIVISPLSAILIDRWKKKIGFITLGGLVSAAALLSIVALPGTHGLLVIVIMVGIAHGLSVSPQIPLVIELMENSGIDRGKTIGIFRLTERVGNIAGPMLAGVTLSMFGFEKTILLFGLGLLFSSVALACFYFLFIKADHKQEVAG